MKRDPAVPAKHRAQQRKAEQFVIAWQTASLAQVCEQFGIDKRAASTRAHFYRTMGVPLRKRPRSGTAGGGVKQRLDWGRLSAIAAGSVAP